MFHNIYEPIPFSNKEFDELGKLRIPERHGTVGVSLLPSYPVLINVSNVDAMWAGAGGTHVKRSKEKFIISI